MCHHAAGASPYGRLTRGGGQIVRRIGMIVVASIVLVAGFGVGSQRAWAAATICNGTLTGNLGAITVPAGGDCKVHDATITGNVHVRRGGLLHMDVVTVRGSVIGSNPGFIELGRDFSGALGPVQITGKFIDTGDQVGVVLCQTTVGGAVVVTKGAAPWIGDPEGDDISGPVCVGNTFHGSLSVINTNSPAINTVIEHNQINGRVIINGNTAQNVIVDGNTIGGSLSCSGNTPAPTDLDGAAPDPNTAASKAGQCSAL